MKMLRQAATVVVAIALVAVVAYLFRPSNEATSREAARSQRPECIVLSSFPVTIDKPGLYCLDGDITVDGPAILVKADFVTIDLKGHTLSDGTGITSQAVGIDGGNFSNLRITNGSITGFGICIRILTPREDYKRGYHQIDNLNISHCGQSALRLSGRFIRVLDNKFSYIGGGPLLPGKIHTHGVAIGGPGALVLRNDFLEVRGTDVTKKSEGVPLVLSGDINGALVAENSFRNLSILPHKTFSWGGISPNTYAIWVGGMGMSSVSVSNNTFENFVNGIVLDVHISGTVTENRAINVAVPFTARDKDRNFGGRPMAGAQGYTPARDNSPRPDGKVYFSNNQCSADDPLIEKISDASGMSTCVTPHDISLDEMMRLIN